MPGNPDHGSVFDQPEVRARLAELDALLDAHRDQARRLAASLDECQRDRDAARTVAESLAPTEAGAWRTAWEEMRDLAARLERERDEAGVLLSDVERSVNQSVTRTGRCPLCLKVEGRPHDPTCRLDGWLRAWRRRR
jgi:hypothetical protein